jgi:hypothetical protein
LCAIINTDTRVSAVKKCAIKRKKLRGYRVLSKPVYLAIRIDTKTHMPLSVKTLNLYRKRKLRNFKLLSKETLERTSGKHKHSILEVTYAIIHDKAVKLIY